MSKVNKNGNDFIKQTKHGHEGNCLEACIASLEGIALDTFPDLTLTESSNGDWWGILNKWLKLNHGFYIETIRFEEYNDTFTRGIVIAVGNSSSLSDELHAVIWDFDKQEMIFDPSPKNQGLKGAPTYFCVLVKYHQPQKDPSGNE